ncbi:spermidine/putrescine ABC transporter substrate-binding protein [Frigidibacter sp. RF13]|uniref:polyamine ABC transporter substrate-binding protein n=1 Tax=Frigidibacter sp. RF13 TaxID=2997340 RepID=UPI00226F156C|nr:spermidine/putrescine ABC transporter substrate-binding protein [Frigidibacter sp. RF13]MCY1126488.1 spermidine/putrescine ABC transporter substrate-binding protein [Frigidibacter sp. RF13]
MTRMSSTLRTLLTGAALAALAGPAFADLVISNWDGYMAPDAVANFSAESGEPAEMVVHATNEEIMGKLIASGGAGYDVVFVSSPFAEVLNNLGLLEPIDPAQVPNLSNLYPEAQALPHDPGNAFSVPYAWGTTGLCYRSDVVSPEPTSWKDLLAPSEANAGKVTLLGTDRWLLAAGFLARGYSVNDSDQAHIDEVQADLTAAKATMLAFDDTTFYAKLVSGEANLVHAWDGWCNYGIAENATIKFAVPTEGSDLWVDTMVVMKASENKAGAFKFINYILDANNHKWAAENILYKVPNQPAMEGLAPEMLEQFPNMAMTPADLTKFEQLRDVGEAMRAYTKAVTEIKAAQ